MAKRLYAIIKGSQDRNLEARANNRDCGGLLLTGLLPESHSVAFHVHLRLTQQDMAHPTGAWVLLHQIAIQKDILKTCSKANLMEAIAHLKCPLPEYVYVCVKLAVVCVFPSPPAILTLTITLWTPASTCPLTKKIPYIFH